MDKLIIRVSFFDSVRDKKPTGGPNSLQEIMSLIRDGFFERPVRLVRDCTDKNERDRHKKNLQSFTASGVFTGNRAGAFPEHNGLMQCDLDGKDHPDMSPEQMREKIENDPHVVAYYISAGGDGLKLIFNVGKATDKADHKRRFEAAKSYLEAFGLHMDIMCSDPTRLCFVSHDPKAFYRDISETKELLIPENLSVLEESQSCSPSINAPSYPLAVAKQALEQIRLKLGDEKPDYQTWLELISGMKNSYGSEGYCVAEEIFPAVEDGEYQEKEKHLLNHCSAGKVFHHAKEIADWKPSLKDRKELAARMKIHLAEMRVLAGKDSINSLKDISEELTKILKSACVENFQILSEKYLGERLFNSEGRDRSPTQKEATVIIAEHFIATLEKNVMGVGVIDGSPHIYIRDHWRRFSEDEIQRSLGAFALAIGHKTSESKHFRSRVEFHKQLLSSAPMLTANSKETLVNFANGTLHFTQEGETFKPHSKQDALTYVLPFSFEENAEAPLFRKYLDRVLPDQECQTVLAEFMGWIFLRDLKLEKVLVLYGHGHNGKSVACDIFTALLGPSNISSLGMDSLKKPESRVPLVGKLLNYGSEVSGNVSPDIFKKAASGEALEFRHLYGDLFTSTNYARLAFNANNLPSYTECTTGYFRRYLIIPFEEHISENEKDPDLASKIITQELAGVMNWVLQGTRRLRSQRKFSPCAKADKQLKKYQHESDTVAQFLEEGLWDQSLNEKSTKKFVFESYQRFCRDNGQKSLGKNNFNKRLKEHHRIADGKDGRYGHYWRLTQSLLPDVFDDEISDLM